MKKYFSLLCFLFLGCTNSDENKNNLAIYQKEHSRVNYEVKFSGDETEAIGNWIHRDSLSISIGLIREKITLPNKYKKDFYSIQLFYMNPKCIYLLEGESFALWFEGTPYLFRTETVVGSNDDGVAKEFAKYGISFEFLKTLSQATSLAGELYGKDDTLRFRIPKENIEFIARFVKEFPPYER